MKFIKIITPKVMSYYVAPKFRELVKDKFIKESRSYISDGELYLIIDYDQDIYDAFKLYISKTEKITNGNMYKYQYELDLDNDKTSEDDMIFKFTDENNESIKASINNAYMDNNSSVFIFKIL